MSIRSAKTVIFSDIDGTLVHYCDQPAELTGKIIALPASITGKQGVISQATLEKAAALRSGGCPFILISGARTATVLQRLPCLPASDAIATENGGRLFYPDPQGITACPLKEDMEWRGMHPAAGPADQELVPPLERKGILWDWYRQLYREGWNLDAHGYTMAFRLKPTPDRDLQEVAATISARPPELACSFNLGVADFYPITSGKEKVAEYLMEKYGVKAEDACFLCDDDNDLPLAEIVGHVFVPSIGHDNMEKAARANPTKFFVATVKWTGGTEEALDAVAAHIKQQCGTQTALSN